MDRYGHNPVEMGSLHQHGDQKFQYRSLPELPGNAGQQGHGAGHVERVAHTGRRGNGVVFCLRLEQAL